jgi:hypothetical protein
MTPSLELSMHPRIPNSYHTQPSTCPTVGELMGAWLGAYFDDRITRVIFLAFLSFFYFLAGQGVGHSFAHVAHFVFLRDAWIRTQNLATNFINVPVCS